MSETAGILIAPRALGWPRLAIAILSASTAFAGLLWLMWPVNHAGTPVANGIAWLELAILGASIFTMAFDRVDLHVFVRAALWGPLVIGACSVVFGDARPHALASWMVLGGSAAALLSLGSAGLGRSDGAFAPRVLRRTLLAMMVVGLCIAHLLATTAAMTYWASADILDPLALSLPSTLFTRVAMIAAPVLLVMGVLGLSRTKTWGLVAYLAALVSIATTIALSWAWVDDIDSSGMALGWVWMMSIVWGLAGMLALVIALPVMSALVFRRVPRAEGKPWGQYLHGILVLGIVAGSVLLRIVH